MNEKQVRQGKGKDDLYRGMIIKIDGKKMWEESYMIRI